MDPIQLIGALLLLAGGAYAAWLCVYRWEAMLNDDPSLQRLAGLFGSGLARVIAILFSVGFAGLGLALLIRGLM